MSKLDKAISKELRRIAAKNGGVLLPAFVVEAARPKSSILHSKFCWDDAKAGHEYRLWQARMLIRVTVSVVAGTGEVNRVWVSLKTDANMGAGYRALVDVMADAELRVQLLQDALADAELFREKYSKLKELAKVFDAMKEVSRRVRKRKG